ncbi:MAG: hypothetical protein K0R00_2691 [Herbinix sp.]|jgi:type I restriction enzyme S subunit|nr:hypothetical protein [Herbinix sp.]
MSNLKNYKFDKLYEMGSGISTSKEQAGSGAPFVSFSTIFNNIFLPDELPDLMDTSEEEQEKYSVKKGDIFLTRTSETLDELAMSCVAIKDYPNATFSGFAKRLRPIQDDITYDKYMAFYLRSDYFRTIINNNAVMTLRASFNEDIFSYLSLYLPEYDEQVKIGDFLFLIEEVIKNNNKINAELDKMARLLYEYWFLQFDFPKEDGEPYKSSGGNMVWNELLNKEIPEDWDVLNLLEAVSWNGGAQPPKSTFIYEEKAGYIRFIQNRDYTDDSYLTYIPISKSNKTCNAYDIMMDKYGDAGKVRFGIEGAYNVALSKIGVILPNAQEYIRQYFNSNVIYNFLHNACIASTRASLNEDILKLLYIVIPKDSILSEFEEIQKQYIDQILLNQQKNRELRKLQEFLMPLLITGQVKIV